MPVRYRSTTPGAPIFMTCDHILRHCSRYTSPRFDLARWIPDLMNPSWEPHFLRALSALLTCIHPLPQIIWSLHQARHSFLFEPHFISRHRILIHRSSFPPLLVHRLWAVFPALGHASRHPWATSLHFTILPPSLVPSYVFWPFSRYL